MDVCGRVLGIPYNSQSLLEICISLYRLPGQYRYFLTDLRNAGSDWSRQAYVFQGMMVNEFSGQVYACGSGCQCMIQTDLAPQCEIRGTGVLQQYGYQEGRTGKWVGILLGIMAVYRLFGWIALVLRQS